MCVPLWENFNASATSKSSISVVRTRLQVHRWFELSIPDNISIDPSSWLATLSLAIPLDENLSTFTYRSPAYVEFQLYKQSGMNIYIKSTSRADDYLEY